MKMSAQVQFSRGLTLLNFTVIISNSTEIERKAFKFLVRCEFQSIRHPLRENPKLIPKNDQEYLAMCAIKALA